MQRLASGQSERGAVLVVAVLMILVLTILGMAASTNSRIERLIAGNDKVHKEIFSSTEHALVLAEATLEQFLGRADLAEETTVGHWGPGQQPPWRRLQWDDTDSQDIARFFHDPNDAHDHPLPALPPPLQRTTPLPRYIVEARGLKRDSLTIGRGEPTGVWTFNVSAKASNASKTTSVTLQSVYAKRYN